MFHSPLHTLTRNVSFSSPPPLQGMFHSPLHTLTRNVSFSSPHPYKECFILLSNRCGISQSSPTTPLGTQRPHWHPYKECFIPLSNRGGISKSTPWGPSVLTGTLIRNASFPSPIEVGSQNPPPGDPARHPYKECFIPLSNRGGISKSTPWGPSEAPL